MTCLLDTKVASLTHRQFIGHWPSMKLMAQYAFEAKAEVLDALKVDSFILWRGLTDPGTLPEDETIREYILDGIPLSVGPAFEDDFEGHNFPEADFGTLLPIRNE